MGRAQIRNKKPHSATTAATTSTSTPRPSTLPLKKSLRLARSKNFVTKIEKSAAKPSGKTRRRKNAASNSLATTLDSLVDALPENDAVNIVSASSKSGTAGAGAGTGKTIKSRPGAQKRKEKMIRNEGVRFGMNMAILETMGAGEGEKKDERAEKPVVKSRWEMLRGFIGQTLERKEEFVAKEKEQAGAGDGMDVE